MENFSEKQILFRDLSYYKQIKFLENLGFVVTMLCDFCKLEDNKEPVTVMRLRDKSGETRGTSAICYSEIAPTATRIIKKYPRQVMRIHCLRNLVKFFAPEVLDLVVGEDQQQT